jgi:Skp family chaperone for outer membrane proteins
MKTFLFPAALAASVIAPAAASAQALPPATIAVVDLDKVTSDCNACRTANAALRAQVTAQENREKALIAPLQTEQKSIQAAIDALKGADADAALQARIKAFQGKQQQAQETAGRGRQQLQRNREYMSQQVSAKLGPIYQQVMTRRGANVMIEIGTTLASGAALDVTNDVLAALNSALPTITTNAPAASQAAPSR